MSDFIRLDEVADIIMGQSPDSNKCNQQGIGLGFLQGCAEFGKLYPEIENYCSEPKKIAPRNSILVSVRAPVGTVNLTKQDLVIGRGLGAVVPKQSDLRFIYYSILSGIQQLERVSQGSTFLAINSEDLRSFLVPKFLPPQQIKIAKILTTLDRVIEKTEAVIAKYEVIKQGMMHDLFTRGIGADGQLRPSYEEAPDLYKESELGWIPNEWEVEQLISLADIRVSNVDKKNYEGQQKVFLCNYMDVYNNRFIKNDLAFMESTASIDEIRKFTLEKEDVIITKDSETPFDIAIPTVVSNHLKDVLCGYHLAILRPDLEKIKGAFLMYNLCLPLVNIHFMNKANGSTRYGLTKETIETANILKPGIDEQVRIIEKLISIEKKIQIERTTLSKQTQLKQGLMQDLLTGKVPVKVDTANV